MIIAQFFGKSDVPSRSGLLYCTVSNMQVSLSGVYIGTRITLTLQRGVRHDQQVIVI